MLKATITTRIHKNLFSKFHASSIGGMSGVLFIQVKIDHLFCPYLDRDAFIFAGLNRQVTLCAWLPALCFHAENVSRRSFQLYIHVQTIMMASKMPWPPISLAFQEGDRRGNRGTMSSSVCPSSNTIASNLVPIATRRPAVLPRLNPARI